MAETLDFIVIGAQKAGTTALWHYLKGHPDLYLAPDKEAAFFTDSYLYERGFPAYMKEYFPDASGDVLVGKITPPYMVGADDVPIPVVVDRIYDTIPEVKLVALLRDPIERATSHYRMSQRRGIEDRSFSQAIEALLEPTALEHARAHPTETNSYVTAGEYGRILSAYRRRFGPEQILIAYSSDLRDRPKQVLRDLLQFVGADPNWEGLENVGGTYFEGGSRRRVSVEAERSLVNHLRNQIYPLIPADRRNLAARSFGFFFESWNVVPDDQRPTIEHNVRKRLEDHFADDAELIRNLGHEPRWMDMFGQHDPSRDRPAGALEGIEVERLSTRVRQLEIALQRAEYRLSQVRRSRGLRRWLFHHAVPVGSRRGEFARALYSKVTRSLRPERSSRDY